MMSYNLMALENVLLHYQRPRTPQMSLLLCQHVLAEQGSLRGSRTSKNRVQQIDDNLKLTLSNNNLKRLATSLEIYIYTMKVLVRRRFHTCSLYALEAEDKFVGSIVSFDSHIVILKITCKQFENRHSYYLAS